MVNFVQVKITDFAEPSEHSVIFRIFQSFFSSLSDRYEKFHISEMVLKKHKQLLGGAVPTVQSPEERNRQTCVL